MWNKTIKEIGNTSWGVIHSKWTSAPYELWMGYYIRNYKLANAIYNSSDTISIITAKHPG